MLKTVLVLLLTLGLTFAQEVYRFGFTAVVAKEDVKSVELFLDYLSRKSGYRFVPIFAKSYDEMSYLLSRNMVDIAYICGAPYVEDKDSSGFELLVVPVYRGKPFYYSYVITRKDKDYRSIFDLKGKPYAFSDPKSNSGSVVPTYVLLRKGYKADRFFKPVVYTYSHSESILAVYYGFVEGASVDSIVFDQVARKSPGVVAQLKVVKAYGPFPITPIVARKGLDEDVKNTLKKILLRMNRDPEGKRILSGFALDGFTIVGDEFYDPIREMISYIKSTDVVYRNGEGHHR